MEIFVALEHLADKFRPHHRAISLDQAPLCLAWKQQLSDSGHRQRISKAGNERERDKDDKRRTDLSQHDFFSLGEM
jgi:hypothetical protein